MTDNNEIDTLSCTLDLSAIDSAEVDKLNNPDLLSGSSLNQMNIIDSDSLVSLDNRACSSSNLVLNELEATTSNSSITMSKPIKRSLRSNTSQQTSPDTESSISTVKEEPVVIIDDKDNSSLIDLTKENDDVMILSVENSNPSRSRTNRIRQMTRRLASMTNNTNSNPSTSASATIIDTTSSDPTDIQEVLITDSNKTTRPCVDITYHFCSLRNNSRNMFNTNSFIRPNRTNRNQLNSTIVLDDERPEQAVQQPPPQTAESAPLQSTVEHVNNLQVQTDSQQIIALTTHSPKRQKVDRTNKNKDNQKSKITTQTTTTSDSGESSIHCPICLETLSELKSNKKRLKSTLCGHILCNLCLEATFKSNGDGVGYSKSILCPTCRTKLTKSKIHDLYL